MILLQIAAESTSKNESLSVFGLIAEGGFMIIPILFLGILSIYIFVERMMALKTAGGDTRDLVRRVKLLILQGEMEGAKTLCGKEDTPASRMLLKGLLKVGRPLKNIETAIENVGRIEIANLEKNLAYLATIAGASPILGFLGTAIGMTKAFMAISSEEGSITPALLSSGLFTALVTTIAGLIVGLLAYLAYNYLVDRIQRIVHGLEFATIEFIDLLQEPQQSGITFGRLEE